MFQLLKLGSTMLRNCAPLTENCVCVGGLGGGGGVGEGGGTRGTVPDSAECLVTFVDASDLRKHLLSSDSNVNAVHSGSAAHWLQHAEKFVAETCAKALLPITTPLTGAEHWREAAWLMATIVSTSVRTSDEGIRVASRMSGE